MQAAKRKVKGQAQKAQAKRDKQKELDAQKKQADLFGDSNQYDAYDQIGEDYEDDFCTFFVVSFRHFLVANVFAFSQPLLVLHPHPRNSLNKQANTETIIFSL